MLGFLVVVLLGTGRAQPDDDKAGARLEPLPQKLDMMVCIDASTSMEGLRDGFAEGLWRVAEDFYSENPNMDFRLGLLRYGLEGPIREDGAERRPRQERRPMVGAPEILQNLTLDFDAISVRLDSLPIGGGREHVAQALELALREARWSADARRTILIAGNESPHQDPDRDLLRLCRYARGQGITVHALYCGGAEDLHAAAWRELAEIGGGRFDTYDLEVPGRTPRLPTPFDRKLADLSGRLTATYLYGASQRANLSRMQQGDRLAARRSLAVSADRAVARSRRAVEPHPDLVARHAAGATVPAAELPKALRSSSAKQRTAALEARAKQRRALRERIRAVAKQRARWYRKNPTRGPRRLEAALRTMILGPKPNPR